MFVKKYNIANTIWTIDFINQENLNERFEQFEVTNLVPELHHIKFSVIDNIEPLPETNTVENGLKMWVSDNVKLFDITDDFGKVVIRGKYDGNISEFAFLSDFNEIQKYEYILSNMRFMEIMSQKGFISLHASCVSLGNSAMIIAGKEKNLFTEKWLNSFANCELITDDKVLLKLENSIFKVYGTPWSGSKKTTQVDDIYLQNIIFLEKAWISKFVTLNEEQKLMLLATDLGIMNDDKSDEELMNFCLDLTSKVNIYKYKGRINDKDFQIILKQIYFNQ